MFSVQRLGAPKNIRDGRLFLIQSPNTLHALSLANILALAPRDQQNNSNRKCHAGREQAILAELANDEGLQIG